MKVVGGDAFLGYGSIGRVFRVIKLARSSSLLSSSSSRSAQLALKIVLGADNTLSLHYEAQHLRKAKSLAHDTVMGVEQDIVEMDTGAGLLLSQVGRRIPHESAGNFVEKVVGALVTLHSHKIVHGDPRLPNIVQVGKDLHWIDFREARFDNDVSSAYVKDMRILVASFIQLPSNALIGELNSAVAAYKPSDADSIANICNCLKRKR